MNVINDLIIIFKASYKLTLIIIFINLDNVVCMIIFATKYILRYDLCLLIKINAIFLEMKIYEVNWTELIHHLCIIAYVFSLL
jgi:hypothetical protein